MVVKPYSDEYFILDPDNVDPVRIKRERDKSRKLKKSHWWHNQINQGICYYCQKKFPSSQLTMDHIVPLARGGQSRRGNIVPACKDCNCNKKLRTPVDEIVDS
jgi:5-methylcytosine-specific restriction enzyme A